MRVGAGSFLALGQLSCAAAQRSPCRGEFASTTGRASFVEPLRELWAAQAPRRTICGLAISGWRDVDHAVYVVRDGDAWSVAVLAQTGNGEWTRLDAPLHRPMGPMLEELCVETVTSRADCSASGLDGTWYYLQAGGGGRTQQAVTWSPGAGSTADVVLDVFFALRAYAGAPPSLKVPAYQTLSAKTYVAHHRLGLFERLMSDALSGQKVPPGPARR